MVKNRKAKNKKAKNQSKPKSKKAKRNKVRRRRRRRRRQRRESKRKEKEKKEKRNQGSLQVRSFAKAVVGRRHSSKRKSTGPSKSSRLRRGTSRLTSPSSTFSRRKRLKRQW